MRKTIQIQKLNFKSSDQNLLRPARKISFNEFDLDDLFQNVIVRMDGKLSVLLVF